MKIDVVKLELVYGENCLAHVTFRLGPLGILLHFRIMQGNGNAGRLYLEAPFYRGMQGKVPAVWLPREARDHFKKLAFEAFDRVGGVVGEMDMSTSRDRRKHRRAFARMEDSQCPQLS